MRRKADGIHFHVVFVIAVQNRLSRLSKNDRASCNTHAKSLVKQSPCPLDSPSDLPSHSPSHLPSIRSQFALDVGIEIDVTVIVRRECIQSLLNGERERETRKDGMNEEAGALALKTAYVVTWFPSCAESKWSRARSKGDCFWKGGRKQFSFRALTAPKTWV